MSGSANSKAPLAVAIPGTAHADPPHADPPSQPAGCIFDELVMRNAEGNPQSPCSLPEASHPPIFRNGTLIEIPDPSPGSPRQDETQAAKEPQELQALQTPQTPQQLHPLPRRVVAISIKNDAQAEHVVGWALEKELVPERDSVVLLHVRQAANGMIGDLTASNGSKEDGERQRSHQLLKRHGGVLKRRGYQIKGVSIRGVDVRGELVHKLAELRCDLLIIGNHASKTIKERIIGCKVQYLTANSPCPVLVVRRNV